MATYRFTCACGRIRYVSPHTRLQPCSMCLSRIRSQARTEARRIQQRIRQRIR